MLRETPALSATWDTAIPFAAAISRTRFASTRSSGPTGFFRTDRSLAPGLLVLSGIPIKYGGFFGFCEGEPMRGMALSLVIFLVGCGASGANDGAGAGFAAGSGGLTGVAGSTTSGGGAPASTAGASGASSSMPALPSIVAIDMLGALIGPSKSNGAEWDGTGSIPTEIVVGLAAAAGQPEVGPLLNFMQQSAIKSLSAPDAYGIAELDPYGIAELDPYGNGFDTTLTITLATPDNNTGNTFQPSWPLPVPGWRSVPFGPGLKVRVTLKDEDIANPDDIGTATINYEDLVEAWTAQDSHWVRVDDQTNRQLLAVQVQVSGVADH
jgi:hypothetical protein